MPHFDETVTYSNNNYTEQNQKEKQTNQTNEQLINQANKKFQTETLMQSNLFIEVSCCRG